MYKIIDVLALALQYGLLALGLILIVLGVDFKFFINSLFIPFIFVTLMFIFIDRAKLSKFYKLFISIGVWFQTLGELYFFNNFYYYDKVMHLLNAIYLYFFLRDIYLKKKLKSRILPFLSVFSLVLLWEIYEFVIDYLLGFKAQGVILHGVEVMGKVADTLIDISASLAGFVAALCAELIWKRQR